MTKLLSGDRHPLFPEFIFETVTGSSGDWNTWYALCPQCKDRPVSVLHRPNVYGGVWTVWATQVNFPEGFFEVPTAERGIAHAVLHGLTTCRRCGGAPRGAPL